MDILSFTFGALSILVVTLVTVIIAGAVKVNRLGKQVSRIEQNLKEEVTSIHMTISQAQTAQPPPTTHNAGIGPVVGKMRFPTFHPRHAPPIPASSEPPVLMPFAEL